MHLYLRVVFHREPIPAGEDGWLTVDFFSGL